MTFPKAFLSLDCVDGTLTHLALRSCDMSEIDVFPQALH
jgi:hypothetical protein